MAFNWTELVVGHENAHVATAALVSVGIIGASLLAKRQLGAGHEAVIPESKISIRALFEGTVGYFDDLCQTVIGENGRLYTPAFAAIFLFILINNLVGMIPGMTPATENYNTTFAMAIPVFVTYHILGIREHGLHYIDQFTGPRKGMSFMILIWLVPLMVVIELISHLVRPLTLTLRLGSVMMGDHKVLESMLSLTPGWFALIPIGVPFYALGILVSIIQAFVFSLLSMVYVSMAISHDH